MPRSRDNATLSTQAQIRKKFGRERIQAAEERLCANCIFQIQHDAPCGLLPIDTKGKDCQYYLRGDQYPKEPEFHVRS